MKKSIIIAMVLFLVVFAAAALFSGCGGNTAQEQTTEAQGDQITPNNQVETSVFTLQELAKYDGKDGRPAYVAVDGVVYNVTGSSRWAEGDHAPCPLDAMAGRDLSQEIKSAPANMREKLAGFPVVGALSQ